MKDQNKFILIISLFLLLLIAIPSGFAIDSESYTVDSNVDSTTNTIDSSIATVDSTTESNSIDSNLLSTNENIGDFYNYTTDSNYQESNDKTVNILQGANDVYFDASLEKDTGDGSETNPYKYLTGSRIKTNGIIHLANGEYTLDRRVTNSNLQFIGTDAEKTIIKYSGYAFSVSSTISFTNLTLSGLYIRNTGDLTATNTIFIGGTGYTADDYNNNFGGAVYTPYNQYYTYTASFTNCTFINNTAEYGGAIYMDSGELTISDSHFINNTARHQGGAIGLEYNSKTSITNTVFDGDISLGDAGGAILLHNSPMTASDLSFYNCQATFGAGICSLNSTLTLSKIKAKNNTAKYNGGVIFHMYGGFSLSDSEFENNSAENGGAILVDNSTSLYVINSKFINNTAKISAGGVYSLSNTLRRGSSITDISNQNIFIDNKALENDHIYETNNVNLEIGSGNYTMYVVNETVITSIPSYYSLIDEGLVSPVKDQETSGNCWAFTAIAVVESAILKASGETLNLSEENMKNLMAFYSDYGWDIDTNYGGYDWMPFGYFTSWLGPVYNSEDSFDDYSLISPVLNSMMHVQNIKFLYRSSYTNNNEIKEAIMKYGAVGTGIYYSSSYLNSNTGGYYCTASSSYYSQNHAVTIVGWDDNYSKYNFYSTPNANGAWIVKNSWNSDWGKDGYFYVSYYDTLFAMDGYSPAAYAIILNDTVHFDKNYQYDIGGCTDYFLNSSSNALYKNVFTASDNEVLAGVSTYFEKTTDYVVKIIVNGEEKLIQSGKTDAGYYTINLNQLIPLRIGDVFEVIFNITVSGEAGIPISEPVSFNKRIFPNNISFVSYDGGRTWKDLYQLSWTYSSHTYTSQVACIKAFTALTNIETFTNIEVIYNDYNPVTIRVTVTDADDNLINTGNVSIVIDDNEYLFELKDGIAEIVYNFQHLNNTVTANYISEDYSSSTNTTNVIISKMDLDLDLNINKNPDLNNVEIIINTSKAINTTVKVLVNEEEYEVELIDGKTNISLDSLEKGNYTVKANIINDEIYNSLAKEGLFSINRYLTIILADNFTTEDYSLEEYQIQLVDSSKNPLANKEIIVIISTADSDNVNSNNINSIYKIDQNELLVANNGIIILDTNNEISPLTASSEINSYNLTTNNNGRVTIPINATGGDYIITIKFNGDNDYAPAELNTSLKVKDKISMNISVNQEINNIEVVINLNKEINETIILNFNGEDYNITTENGEAKINFESLENNNYTISAELLNDNDYSSNKTVKTVEINVNELYIISEDFNTSDLSNETYSVNLIDSEGNPVLNKTILFNIERIVSFNNDNSAYNAEITAVSDENGIASIPINLEGGIYNITVYFVGDNEFFSQTNSSTIVVKNIIDFNITISQESNNAFINIKLSKSIDGSLVIALKNFESNTTVNYTLTAYNGRGILSLKDLENGNYELSVNLVESDNYISNLTIKEFSVNLNEVQIISEDLNTKEDIENDFVISLIDENNKAVVGKELEIIIINSSADEDNRIISTISETTDENGTITIPINLSAGTYELTINFSGDKEYTKTSKTNTITVIENVEINIDVITDFGNAIIDINLSKELNDTITVTVNDKEYEVSIVDGKGNLSLDDLNNGDYTVNIELEDYQVNATANFIIDKDIIIVADNITSYDNESISYTISLIHQNQSLANKTLSIVLDGVVTNITTDDEGKASITIENKSPGVYDIVIVDFENNNINTEKLTVLNHITNNTDSRKSTMLHFSDMETYAIDVSLEGRIGKYFDVNLTDSEGKPLFNKFVQIGFNGKVYNRTTNATGGVRLQINLQYKGTYTFAICFLGDNEYIGSFDISKIVVKAQNAKLTSSNKGYKPTASSKTISATFKTTTGKVISGKKISFTINGKTYSATTNSKGVATVKVSLSKKGTYSFTAKYAGDSRFAATSVKAKVIIQ